MPSPRRSRHHLPGFRWNRRVVAGLAAAAVVLGVGVAGAHAATTTSTPATQAMDAPRSLGDLNLAPLSSSSGYAYEIVINPKADEQFGVADFKLWLPVGTTQVYGVLVQGVHGGLAPGETAPMPDEAWRDVAARYHLAVVTSAYTHQPGTPAYRETYGEYGAGAALLRALEGFSVHIVRPELATAKLVLDGYSGSALLARGLAKIAPERIAAMTIGGTSFPDAAAFPKTAQIPVLLYGGANDDALIGSTADLAKGRAAGAPWALTLQPQTGRSVRPTTDIVRTFQSGAALQRLNASPGGPLLPVDLAKGWLGAPGGASIAAYADYKGDLTTASWLPTKAAAVEWQGYWTRRT